MSAPVFHNIMDGSLRLMDVPPDHVEQWYASNAPKPAAAAPGIDMPGIGAPTPAVAVPAATMATPAGSADAQAAAVAEGL